MMDLKHIPTEALEQELAGRRDKERCLEERDWAATTNWCDSCKHFAFGDRRNNCTKNHRMEFHTPDSPIDDAWGFYRDGCDDYRPRPAEEFCPLLGHVWASRPYATDEKGQVRIYSCTCQNCGTHRYRRFNPRTKLMEDIEQTRGTHGT